MIGNLDNLFAILEQHANVNANKYACTVLEDSPKEQYTFLELYRRSCAIAAFLQQGDVKSERVLILLPQGLDYIASFFGCLYAGAIAVPAYQPVTTNHAARAKAIIQDAKPKYIIAEPDVIAILNGSEWLPYVQCINLINIRQITDEFFQHYQPVKIATSELAFLQYSSGSTGIPKGIMVSHENIMANLKMMQKAFKQGVDSIFVSWVPLFHDMGLSIATLLPIYLGIELYLMSPFTFIRKPIRWLKAISDYRGTMSPAPDFAYKICIEGISDTEKTALDLSCWQVALTGSEPIRKETLERFFTAFKSCGFKKQAFYPAYGLAESTVFATGGDVSDGPLYYYADALSLQNNLVLSFEQEMPNSRVLVDCGTAWLDEKVLIVNPTNLEECRAKEIGEVWLSGDHIARGYWNKQELSQQLFQAYTANGGGPFLRTGDLGFLDKNNHLFIVGRIKDIIIINGKNHAAHDIEETVQKAHSILSDSTIVAFSVDENNQEKLIITIGIKNHSNLQVNEITKSIKQAVYNSHDVIPSKILFTDKGAIHKTTSGKLQRQKVKESYLANSLNIDNRAHVALA